MSSRLLLSPAEFTELVDGAIADGKYSDLLDLAGELPDVASQLKADGVEGLADLPLAIDNVAALSAIGLRRAKLGIYTGGVDALHALYDLEFNGSNTLSVFERINGAVLAIAATAIDMDAWERVRELVLHTAPGDSHYETWLRHAQVEGSRAQLPGEDDNVIELAANHLRLHPGFGLQDKSDQERLTLACQADVAAHWIIASLHPEQARQMSYYPSYAKFPAEHVEPVFDSLRWSNSTARRSLFPHDNDAAIANMRELNELALSQAVFQRHAGRDWQYRGVETYNIWFFVREGHLAEQWPTT